MAQIKLSAKETLLKLISPFDLISNQISYDTCLFEFGEEWTGYTKTAVFYSENSDKIQILLDETNICTIPWENIINSKLLYIGVYGIKDTVLVPTNFVILKMKMGAWDPEEPLPPTLDAYAQLLTSFDSTKTYVLDLKNAATDSAVAASTSETNAAASAVSASNMASNALSSANNASICEENVYQSEYNASVSAGNALASKNSASTSETNAANSAAAASTSETNAANSAAAASTSETNAANSAISTANSASNIIASEEQININTKAIFDTKRIFSNAIPQTGSGTTINLKDTIDAPIIDIVIEGASQQTVTEQSPSPEIPAPIANTGDSAYDLVICGKNVFPGFPSLTANGITLTANSDGTITLNGTATSDFNSNNVNVTNYFGYIIGSITRISGTNTADIILHNWNLSYADGRDAILTPGSSTCSTTKSSGDRKERITVLSGCVCNNLVLGIQLEVGTVVTNYEPYKTNKQTLTQLLSSLLNGTKNTIEKANNILNHVNRVDRSTFDGSVDENWVQKNDGDGSTTISFQIALPGAKTNNSNILSTNFKQGNSSTDGIENIGMEDVLYIEILRSRLTTQDPAGFKTWLSTNPVTAYYELETPIFTPLADIDLTTYKSNSNIFTTASVHPNLTVIAVKDINTKFTNAPITHNYSAGAIDWVLSNEEQKSRVLVCTNAAANANVILPSGWKEPYTIKNDSGYTITAKTSTSTGVQIANGKTETVIFIDIDYLKIVTDFASEIINQQTEIESQQAQINAITAAGVESDYRVSQALVDGSNKTWDTLKERLDNGDSQLAQITTQKADEVDLAIERERINLLQTSVGNYYIKCLSTDSGALLVVASGATTGQINLASVTPRLNTYTPVAGDYVRLISNGLTAETIDGRIGANGVNYSNLGGAIRTQIGDIKDQILTRNTNTKNKLNPLKVEIGGIYYSTTGNWMAIAGYWSTELIPVSEFLLDTFYCINSKNCHVTYWNSSKAFISGTGFNGINGSIYCSSSNGTAYVRVGVGDINYNVAQIEKGSTPSTFVPYFIIDTKKIYVAYSDVKSKLKDKKISFLGDSITFGVGTTTYNSNWTLNINSYVNQLAALSGCNVYNHGINAATVALNNLSGIGTMQGKLNTNVDFTETPDILVLFGSTNDYWLYSTSLGDSNSNDRFTLCGAINYIVQWFATNFPSTKLIFITPYQQWRNDITIDGFTKDTYGGYSSNLDFGYGKLKAFRDAIIERGENWGVPVLDLFKIIPSMANVNEYRSVYATYGDVHPNDYLHLLIANILKTFLENNL